MDLSNVPSERIVLAGICTYGLDCYLDVEAFLEENTFTIDYNKIIYKCIKHIIHKHKPDLVSIIAAATDLSLGEFVQKQDVLKHINGILNTPVQIDSVLLHAKKIRRLQFARKLQETIKLSYKKLEDINGEESLSDIISVVETPIQDASISFLKKDENKPKLLGEGGVKYFDYLMSDEKKQIGVPSPFPSYNEAIGGGFLRKAVDLVGGRTKALRYGSKVYTKNGPINIEDLKVGDCVLHPFSTDSLVEEVFDFDNKDIYRVSFKDGDYVDCCEDHLWEVYKRYPYGYTDNKDSYILSTKDLIGDLRIGNKKWPEYKWDIRLPNPVQYTEKNLPIDPYILGVLIGDGSLIKTCTYTSMDDEIINSVNSYFEALGYEVKIDQNNPNTKCISYRINGFQDKLREVGLFKHTAHNKFIPDIYKYNSVENRIAILQGLLDTDGCCNINPKNGSSRIKFTSASKRLATDLKEIVTSLGGICSLLSSKNKCNDKYFDCFNCEIRLPNHIIPFRLTRKAKLVNDRMIGELKRSIKNIEKITKDKVRCIRVSNPDGLYLTDNHVITHNSGKSQFCDNVAFHVANIGIPVLVLDTEMSETDHWNRLWANISGITVNEIKFATFKDDPAKVKAVSEARDKLSSIPYYYINVSGKEFDHILSIARRWILKEVGFDSNGRTKDCLIIYDYFKLMSSEGLENMQEFQAMGFQATKLHNFTVEHDCSCLAFVQLNRSGIDKETSDVISQSDRIGWICTSFTILKDKSAEEIADDGPRNGNKKLVTVLARHGSGSQDGYVCLELQGELARMREIGHVRNIQRRDFPERPEGEDEGEDS